MRATTAVMDVPEVGQQSMVTGGRSVGAGGVEDSWGLCRDIDATDWQREERKEQIFPS